MGMVNYLQVGVFFIQGFIVISLLLFLFRIRKSMGNGLLYVTLGLFQFLQVLLASTISVTFAPGFVIPSGSVVLFTSAFFIILLIYIKEDAVETRRVIYAIVFANLLIVLLIYLFGFNADNLTTTNFFDVSATMSYNSALVLIIGTLLLLVDAVLLILFYEFVSKYVRSLFARIFIATFIALGVDNLLFHLLLTTNPVEYFEFVKVAFVSKSLMIVFYSAVLFIYLKYIDKDSFQVTIPTFKDVFHALTYRQKYELISQQTATVKKEAERAIQLSKNRFQTLTKISPVGIFQTNADGKTTYVNPKWCEISGLSLQEALNDGWLDAVHPDDKIKLKSGWYDAVDRKSNSAAEYRFIHADGTVKWVLGQVVPEYDYDNNIIGYVGTTTDISILKQFEQELNLAKDKAEESSRLKAAFIQNISHEIRTPMNAIAGFSSLLTQPDLSDDEIDEFIEIIVENADQLLAIISDIFTISSLETMQEKVTVQSVDVNQLLRNLQSVFNKEIGKKPIKLELLIGSVNGSYILETDKTKLTQIITNLLNNALKFTNSGTITFGYELESSQIEFFVKDSGIGIAKEMHDKIFDRFRQLNDPLKTKYGGTGLGLSISKGFVELLGGDIRVKSEPNKGTEFYFSLPT